MKERRAVAGGVGGVGVGGAHRVRQEAHAPRVARRAATLLPCRSERSPMRRTVDRPWLCWQRRVERRCSRWGGARRGRGGWGAPGALEAPRRPRRAAPGSAQLRQLRRTDLVRPIDIAAEDVISARRLARRQPLPGRQGHHWGCIGRKKQLRTRETAHAPRYSATQDGFQSGNSRFGHFRPIVTKKWPDPPHAGTQPEIFPRPQKYSARQSC